MSATSGSRCRTGSRRSSTEKGAAGNIVSAHREYVAGETLAIEITYAHLDGAEPVMIDGRPL